MCKLIMRIFYTTFNIICTWHGCIFGHSKKSICTVFNPISIKKLMITNSSCLWIKNKLHTLKRTELYTCVDLFSDLLLHCPASWNVSINIRHHSIIDSVYKDITENLLKEMWSSLDSAIWQNDHTRLKWLCPYAYFLPVAFNLLAPIIKVTP